MNIQLSDHFTYKKLIRFTVPPIIMMIFTSVYGVVDGVFVSNYTGKTAFAAINLIMPVLMLFGALGFMIGTGGSALVSKTLGEGDTKKANSLFSMLVYVTIILGIVLTVIGFLVLKPIAGLLGAEGEILDQSVVYGKILLVTTAPFMLQNAFQSFLVAAEKPNLGLAVTVIAGVLNIVLDALFVAVFKWGLVGAAVATSISQLAGGLIPLLYFALSKKSILRLGKCELDVKSLLKTCANGSSELMSNVSMSLVSMLYNYRLLQLAGENGIAAYGVIMYVNFIFSSAFLGYSIGSAPVISYNYGAGNYDELKNLKKKSLTIVAVGGVVLTAVAEIAALPLSMIFASYDDALLQMTHHAFRVYSLSFLVSGFNVFGSAFFTALNDGPVSAAISFLRTLFFQVITVLALPIFFGLDGIWSAVVVAEVAALAVTVTFFVTMRKKYNY